jgi:hypothetical protein
MSLLSFLLKSENPAEESVLDLVAASVDHLLLDKFPVLAMLVEEVDQLQVFLQRPLLFAQVRPQVVLIVVLQLLMVSVSIKDKVLGNLRAKADQLGPSSATNRINLLSSSLLQQSFNWLERRRNRL